MRYRAILYHGTDEVWSKECDVLLELLSESNRAMAKQRQKGRRCDGGVLLERGAETMSLKDEHWIRKRL